MKVLSASHLAFDVRWTLRRHTHDRFHELIVLYGGEIETLMDSTSDAVIGKAGESLLYPRGIGHAERSIGNRTLKMVCISFDSDDTAVGPAVSPDTEGRVRLLANWLAELMPIASPADQQTANALMTAIVAERAARVRTEDRIVQQVRRHVREHLAEHIGLEDLAELCCLSRYHFARRFRLASGLSPMDFVRRQRVEAARALMLTAPGTPLRAVARAVGLVNEFHLSRVYKRVTGLSPTEARPGR